MANDKIGSNERLEPNNQKQDKNNLIMLFNRVVRNWYWFVFFAALGIAFAYLQVRYTVPTYKIQAKLLVSDDKKGGGGFESSPMIELSGLMGAKSSVDNEVEVLKTKDLMYEMVVSEGAFIEYFKVGKIHDVPVQECPYELWLLSNPDSIISTRTFTIDSLNHTQVKLSTKDTILNLKIGSDFYISGVGKLSLKSKGSGLKAISGELYKIVVSPPRSKAANLMSNFSVSVTNKNVSTIDLALDHQLPSYGERLLRSLINKYVERNLHDKNVIADSTLSFINARLSRITDELAGVEDRISGYKKATQLADISEQSKILLQNSSEVTKEMAQIEAQLSVLDAMSKYLEDSNNPRVVPSAVIPQDVAFNSLVTTYNTLVLQRERLLMANTAENPIVQNVSEQIAGVRKDMINNVYNTKRQLELSKERQSQLSQSVISQIQKVPTIERGYIDLARLQQIKQAQYIFLQEKWEETAIGRTSNVSNSKVIDSPKADQLPFAPKTKLLYLVSICLGLIFPLLVIYLREVLNLRIENIDDIGHYSNLPIIGMISHSQDSGQVVVTKTSRSPIAEQFRALRTNLEFVLTGGKTILFTSSMSGEGKSYVALNLAVALALLDKKVLIMELDLRKPSITSKLGLATGNGFSHYIVRSDMQVDEIIMPSGAHENVDLIQAGAIPPNPAELLVHTRMKELIESLSTSYDYILMDAPPVGVVTDAQLLARYSDCCLYLVRQGFTYKEQLRIPNDLVSSNKIKPIHLIVNDVQKKGSSYSGYGYGYGYGYGDYGQEPKRKKWWTFWKK